MSNYSITPEGAIHFCQNIPLKPDYSDIWSFANGDERLKYFQDRTAYNYTDYTYIKKDSYVNVDENVDKLRYCNYLYYNSYNNGGLQGSKTYFCFITGMEYINENCTRVYFTTDVWTTYLFDIAGNPCFIERQHVGDDSVGANILDEGINVGEYQQEGIEEYLIPTTQEQGYYVIIETNYTPKDESNVPTETDKEGRANKYSGVTCYDGAIKGFQLVGIFIETSSDVGFANSIKSLVAFIHRASTDGYVEDVHDMYVVPTSSISDKVTHHHFYDSDISNEIFTYNLLNNNSFNNTLWYKSIPMKTFSSYKPKNNKCYTYPFNYMQVSDMQGNTANYKFENFIKGTEARFNCNFTAGSMSRKWFTISCSI